jgi:hypothetical protein
MNYRFNIEEWVPRFPLAPRYANRYQAAVITSPGHLCNNVQLREELPDALDWGRSVPADVFVMAQGEPDNRHATKIGGLPYRPANLHWPLDKVGVPLAFLAQFNFFDSHDIFPDLPHDLLLIFAGDNGELRFEWQPLGLEDLTDGSDAPPQEVPILPCYGHIFRTENFPDVPFLTDDLSVRGRQVDQSFLLPRFQATQIGTAPFLIQQHLLADPLPGRLLCTLNSVDPDSYGPYPFVNRAEPLLRERQWARATRYFTLDDAGGIYISIDDGQLHWRSCSY